MGSFFAFRSELTGLGIYRRARLSLYRARPYPRAQAPTEYPRSARFPSMPINAVETGCVDFVLRPNEIAREVTRLTRRPARPAGVARSVSVVADKARPRRDDGATDVCLQS